MLQAQRPNAAVKMQTNSVDLPKNQLIGQPVASGDQRSPAQRGASSAPPNNATKEHFIYMVEGKGRKAIIVKETKLSVVCVHVCTCVVTCVRTARPVSTERRARVPAECRVLPLCLHH